MGNFSRDTFDKLKHYVGVRLQQGVPIVDADWNEMEDIRKYELQAFLKWFIGNGVPLGNDGFRITALAAENDFAIQGGDGTADGAGRCLVEGLDVMNETALNYTAQVLYNNDTLATAWGVPVLPPLITPGSDRTDTVYLDVWEREVDSTEDPNLVNEAIGLETAVRRKREWVVRVAANSPTPPTPATGHAHYALAHLNRTAGSATIPAGAIADRRIKGLRLPSYYDIEQIKLDAFGSSYTLDSDGQPNLPVSLREAINALLRGGLPTSSELQLTAGASYDYSPSALQASNGDIWLFWNSYPLAGGSADIWYKQYSQATGTWGADTQLTTDTNEDNSPVAVEDSSGDIWVFWQSYRSGSSNIWYNRYNGTWQGDTNLSNNTDSNSNPKAVVDGAGRVWVFWYRYVTVSGSSNSDIWYDRHTPGTDWQGSAALTSSTDNDYSPQVLAASNGDIWVFWYRYTSPNYDIWSRRYQRSTSNWLAESRLTFSSDQDIEPVAIEDGSGTLWVFWRSNRNSQNDIWYMRLHPDGYWLSDTALTADALYEYNYSLLGDATGGLWVFWASSLAGVQNISYKTYTAESGWGPPRQLTSSWGGSGNPTAILNSQGQIQVFWTQQELSGGGGENGGPSHLWTKILTPQI